MSRLYDFKLAISFLGYNEDKILRMEKPSCLWDVIFSSS